MKKAKRWRSPRAKPGQLKVQWGKLPDDDPDIVYSGGIGTNGCDRALLHHVFGSPRYTYDGNTTPSLYDELEARGYDLTTLKFSIEKRTSWRHKTKCQLDYKASFWRKCQVMRKHI